ncbi:MAG TPA: chalcone isomerase family protein [Candidatus Limnocylindria bacterium]|nr:chalcone isomerase family protein [Candidatus Limnocylindria bacterium]
MARDREEPSPRSQSGSAREPPASRDPGCLVPPKGADFASAYFAIWLGRNPIDKPLKEQLLRKDS